MKILILVLLATLSGCTSIHFDNGKAGRLASFEEPQVGKWHHNVVFDLIEVSSPVDLERECKNGEWASVETERSFMDGLAAFGANLFMPVPVWHPKTVRVHCQ